MEPFTTRGGVQGMAPDKLGPKRRALDGGRRHLMVTPNPNPNPNPNPSPNPNPNQLLWAEALVLNALYEVSSQP